jgi:hypothetical protein
MEIPKRTVLEVDGFRGRVIALSGGLATGD